MLINVQKERHKANEHAGMTHKQDNNIISIFSQMKKKFAIVLGRD